MTRTTELWERHRSLIISSLGVVLNLSYLLFAYVDFTLVQQKSNFWEELGSKIRGEPWLYLGLLSLIPLFMLVGLLLGRAERERRRFQTLFKAASDGIYVRDLDGTIKFVNSKFLEIHGLRPDQVIGKRSLELSALSPQERKYNAWLVRQAILRGEPPPLLEAPYRRRDGSTGFLQINLAFIKEEGQVKEVMGIVRDITERKRLETQLKESEERYRNLFENANDAIYALDRQGNFTSFNRKAEQLTGFMLKEVLGQRYTILVRGAERRKARRYFVKNMRGESHTVEMTITCKDGHEIVSELSTRPIWQDGQIVGVQGIARDVTERRELERLKADFVSTVSHELRTPLTSIKGYVDLVLAGDTGPLTAEQQEFLRIVAQNTSRLTDLINDLLEIERLEGGQIEFEFQELALEEVLSDVTRALRLSAEQKKLKFSIDTEKGLMVHGDRDRLAQVFTNLLSNAIKYTPQGSVRVHAHREGDAAVVSVSETGIGISEGDLKKLFQKFFRSEDPYVRKAGGTGLGLSIAKAIVERHGGRIDVTSQLGKGSVFTVRLPVLARKPEVAASRPTVLVIDDEVAIARLIAKHIENMGYQAITAYSAREGLDLAVHLKPQLIALDVLMPDLDGFEVLRQLKKHPATAAIPVIFLSIIQDRQQGLRLGASAFLTKPIDEQKLHETVRALLEPHGQPVLVVDDDRDFAKLLQRLLAREGLLVETAGDGEEALEKIGRRPYQLVVLDKNMPKRSGLEVLQELRSQRALSHVPVIVISGSEHAEELARDVQILGAKKFLSKRLEPKTIVQEIVRFLQEHREA